jgi:enoyl-CoA hydratase
MPLHVERREAVAIFTLDEPTRRNALTPALVSDIVAAVSAVEDDEGVGAVVVTGAPPAFCSGADLGELSALSPSGARDPAEVRGIYEGFLAIRDCTLPTIAAVNGPAVGAGVNLALACDVRLVCPDARFDSRFARIGLHPGGGHTWMLERAVGPQAAAALDLFGERIDGERAVEIGLAWRCAPAGHLVEAAVELAARAAATPRELLRRIKATLREAPLAPSFAAALELELERQRWSLEQGFLTL